MARKPSGKKSPGKKPKKPGRPKKKKEDGSGEPLLTLTEVSKRTGISMPTLQKYKRNHQGRIPAVGKGRKQRYPEAALAVFEEIKQENLQRRGRPAKRGGSRKKRAKASAAGKDGLISLAEISRRTKISYPTLLRYQKLYGDRIPSHGSGRKRRYPEEAIAVFEEIRAGSRRGRRPAARAKAPRTAQGTDRGLAKRIERIEAMQAELSRQLDAVVRLLKKPLQVTIRPE